MISDSSTGNFYLYDDEGRICAVKSEPVSGTYTMTQHIYDAEGTRVAKGTITSWSCNNAINIATNLPYNGFTPTSSYVLGLANEQVTETDGSGNWVHTNVYAGALIATYDLAPTGDPAVHFQLADWLGTRRVQTDISGNPEETDTSLPFGDGLTTAVVSGPPATADDATEHHFAGKEHDSESGNDYFGARYYDSNIGRFMSPDWSAQVEPVPYSKLLNPQSLNLYAYVLNNPLSSTDTDGHEADSELPNTPVEAASSAYAEGGNPAAAANGWYNPPATSAKPQTQNGQQVQRPKLGQPGGRQLDPNGAECKSLAQTIDNMVKKIDDSDFDLVTNPGKLPQTAPPGSPLSKSVDGHVELMEKQINELGAAADLYNNKCGGGPPPPTSASSYGFRGSNTPSRSFSSVSPMGVQAAKAGIVGIIVAVTINFAWRAAAASF